MKLYTKDGEIFKTPITIVTEAGVKYTNNEKDILAAGYTIYEKPQEPVSVLIEHSDKIINSITDDKILNGFTFKDNEFYLTVENQTNFSNMFIAREYLTYPQKIKTKTGYMYLADAAEVAEFYLAGVNFVKQCLEEGWAKKDAASVRIKEANEVEQ